MRDKRLGALTLSPPTFLIASKLLSKVPSFSSWSGLMWDSGVPEPLSSNPSPTVSRQVIKWTTHHSSVPPFLLLPNRDRIESASWDYWRSQGANRHDTGMEWCFPTRLCPPSSRLQSTKPPKIYGGTPPPPGTVSSGGE